MSRGYWLIFVAVIVLITGYSVRTSVPELLPPNNGRLDLSQWNFAHRGPVRLDGTWTFYPNRLLTPTDFHRPAGGQAPAVFRPPVGGIATEVPSVWENGNGYGTYVLEITGLDAADNLGLFQQPACHASRTWLFAAQSQSQSLTIVPSISTMGKVGTRAMQTEPGQKASVATLSLEAAGPHYLLVQVANFDHRLGGLCRNIYLGPLQQLFDVQLKNLIGQGLTISIIFSMTLYAFAIYLYTSRNRSPLWLGLSALTVTLYFWTRANLWEQAFGIGGPGGFRFHYAIEYCALMLVGPLLVSFYHHSYRTHYLPPRVICGNLILALMFCAMVIATPPHWFTQHLNLLIGYTLLQLALATYILCRGVADRQPYSGLLLASIFPLFLTLPVDFINSINSVPRGTYSEYAMVFFTFIQCLIQGQRLSSAVQRSRHLSASLAEEVRQQTASLEEKNYELLIARTALEEANRDLKALSITDGLTGAYNRLYFDRQFLIEWQRSRREQAPLSLALVDIDHFKTLNDTHGHLAGDQGLKNIVTHMQAVFKRASDIVCRYGGEEFVVLLPNTPPEQAAQAAENLRQLIAATPMYYKGLEIGYTVSIGVGGLIPEPEHQPLDLLSATDQALYQIKRNGRNGVHLARIMPANIRA